MTSFLALDLGTATGYAYVASTPKMFPEYAKILSGTWSLKPGKFDGGGMRGVKFLAFLDGLPPMDRVVFEAVRRHNGTDAAHVYGGLMMTLQTWCENQTPPIPYEGVPVGTIKKFATGKGNASKDEMIAAVKAKGYLCKDDNEADAVALLLCVLDRENKSKNL